MADGCLYIYGEGPMTDYTIGTAPWAAQSEEIYSIHIGSGVTTVGSHAFEYLAEVTGAIIPDTVTAIGDYGFAGCIDLGSLSLGESVTSIGENAFVNCVKLNISCIEGSAAHQYAVANGISYTLTSITYVLGIDSLTLPVDTAVELPSPVFAIQAEGGTDSELSMSSSNSEIISVGSASLTAEAEGSATVTLVLTKHPSAMHEIEVTVVYDMDTLTLPAALTTLKSRALTGLAAERIVLPASLTSIASDALTGNTQLKLLVVSGAELHLPEGLLSGCGGAVVLCPKGSAAAADCAQYGIPYVYAK